MRNTIASGWRPLCGIAMGLVGLVHCGTLGAPEAYATGNVALALDGMILNNIGPGQPGWAGFGRFSYSATLGESATLGRYGAFTIAEPGAGGGGVGVNFALEKPAVDSPRDAFLGEITPVTSNMFPLLDRAAFGVNFVPADYVAELVYKPLPTNTATQLNMTLDTHDGYDANGVRLGEQVQWAFSDLLTKYTAGAKDADGFVTVRNNGGNLTTASSVFRGQSFMFTTGNPTGDQEADFNDFEGGVLPVPNGAVQIHLQTLFGGGSELIDAWEVKAVRVVKIAGDSREVARWDGHSGFSQRFGSPFARNTDTPINVGGVDYIPPATDQVSRFTSTGIGNIVINTDDDLAVGGIGLFQSAASTVFDGTNARVEVTARLPVPQGAGQASQVVLILKDKDGNDTGLAGDFGGDEYRTTLELGSFTSTMSKVEIPLNTFTTQIANEFANAGDNQLTNFNLYMMQIQTIQGGGLVDLEIESIRVVVPGRAGDLDGDNDVDGNDFLAWQRTDLTPGTLTDIKNNFGQSGSTAAGSAAPEPGSAALALCAAAAFVARGQRRRTARRA